MTPLIEFDFAKGFPLQDVALQDVAKLIGGKVAGMDRPVQYLALLKGGRGATKNRLSYVESPAYWKVFCASDTESAIVSQAVLANQSLPADKSVIVVADNPALAFFEAHERLYQNDRYPRLRGDRGAACVIHPRAFVDDGVVLGERVRIDANVTIYPNTVIGDDTWLKAGCVIGGPGFERKRLFGRLRTVTHVGGVALGPFVEIGSSSVVDCHLIGRFTSVGANTRVDNLVHVAHGAVIGEECSIVAGSEISGSVILGNGVWLGPHTCSNHEVTIGDHAFAGTGSVITGDVPSHALVYGNPAKVRGWVCACRTKLADGGNLSRVTCTKCGTRYERTESGGIRFEKATAA
jgi:UDP-3-O-[3-hydroxymyristoyl] glucosamine N-acyltransferase